MCVWDLAIEGERRGRHFKLTYRRENILYQVYEIREKPKFDATVHCLSSTGYTGWQTKNNRRKNVIHDKRLTNVTCDINRRYFQQKDGNFFFQMTLHIVSYHQIYLLTR